MTHIISIPKKIDELLAEETGWHIGDGSMNFYMNRGRIRGIYQLRGHILDDKSHYLNKIAPVFKFLYGIKISLREMPSTRVYGFQIWNDKLVKFKQSLGLPLGKKVDVTIPEIFLKGDSLKTGVIRGIFDTDGCVYLEKKNHKLYPRLQITTISEKLAIQLYNILNSMEIRTTITKYSCVHRGNRSQEYTVCIRGTEMFGTFMKLVKPENSKHIEKYELLYKNL